MRTFTNPSVYENGYKSIQRVMLGYFHAAFTKDAYNKRSSYMNIHGIHTTLIAEVEGVPRCNSYTVNIGRIMCYVLCKILNLR